MTFDDYSDSTMVWEFDDMITAVYNTNYVLWNGWSTYSFGHYSFTLTKRVETVEQMIRR